MLTLVAILVVVAASLSTPAAADGLDDYIRAELARRRIPGLALAVLRHGQSPMLRAYGLASVELSVPVTPETVFELASLTKPVTATAIMMLVGDGKLALDDPIAKHISQAPRAWAAITVRHLLTHTSGIAPPLSFGSLYASKQPLLIDYTSRQLFEAATRDVVAFAPGERHVYRDTNYFLLGMVIARISGERYADFLARRIFQPLGMTSTSFADAWQVVPKRP